MDLLLALPPSIDTFLSFDYSLWATHFLSRQIVHTLLDQQFLFIPTRQQQLDSNLQGFATHRLHNYQLGFSLSLIVPLVILLLIPTPTNTSLLPTPSTPQLLYPQLLLTLPMESSER